MINPAAVAVLVHAALARAGCSRSARDGAPRYSIPAAVPWYAALSRVSSVPDLRGTGSPTPASEPTAAGPTVPGYNNQTAAAVAGGADPGSRKPKAVRPWSPDDLVGRLFSESGSRSARDGGGRLSSYHIAITILTVVRVMEGIAPYLLRAPGRARRRVSARRSRGWRRTCRCCCRGWRTPPRAGCAPPDSGRSL